MKSDITLKEVLRPPFGRSSVNGIADQFWPLLSADTYRAFTFKGRVSCDSLEYDNLRSEFIDFVAAALNEKWERDYGEPLRELDDDDEEGVYCSDCVKFYVDDNEVSRCKDKPGMISVDIDVCEPCPGYEGAESPRWIKVWRDPEHKAEGAYYKCPKCEGITYEHEEYNFCPHCSQRLLPPEERTDDKL